MNPETKPCPVAAAVAQAVIERSQKGITKYGVNLARQDLTWTQWLQHLQEELLDAACYIERLKVLEKTIKETQAMMPPELKKKIRKRKDLK